MKELVDFMTKFSTRLMRESPQKFLVEIIMILMNLEYLFTQYLAKELTMEV